MRLAEDMRAFGFGEAAIAAAVAEQQPRAVAQALVVHPDNGTAVRLFLALLTQWRTAALSTMASARILRTGLDYAVVETTARLAGLDLRLPDDFARLRIMEAEAIAAWADEAAS